MPPHSLLRACSAGVPCGIQSHATSQSLTSLFGWCALRHSEPCHLTVSYEPVRLVYDSAVFRAMPPHSLLRACSVRRIRRIAQYKKLPCSCKHDKPLLILCCMALNGNIIQYYV